MSPYIVGGRGSRAGNPGGTNSSHCRQPQHEKCGHAAQTEQVVATDGTGQARLFGGAVGAGAEPGRVGDGAHHRQQNRDAGENGGDGQQPDRIGTEGEPESQRAPQYHHYNGDQEAHRPRRRRGTVVVACDGREHGFRKVVGATMAEDLSVEDQVHPQDGEQKAAAGGRDQTLAASLSSLRVLVASRYSCTQRSMTAEDFSTLVN